MLLNGRVCANGYDFAISAFECGNAKTTVSVE